MRWWHVPLQWFNPGDSPRDSYPQSMVPRPAAAAPGAEKVTFLSLHTPLARPGVRPTLGPQHHSPAVLALMEELQP